MLEAIITYLNLKLGLLNYFEQQHCLCELKSDNEGKVSPVEYVGNANYTVVSHDAFDGVSYWRLRDKPTQDVLETKYQAGKRVEVKIPLRLVFSVRRTKLTTDDAYAFDRIRQTVVAQFNFDDGILKTTLGADKVMVSVPTSNGDAKSVWDEETSETGTFEPTYAMVYGSIDIEVSVIYAGSCLPTECDDIDPNILHAFDFCKPSVVAQLTPEQVTCLEGELCVPLCDQLADVLPEDVVADVFDCLTLAAQTELLDSECVIPPCSPVTQQVNGTTIGTTVSGGTNNQLIRNTAGSAVGTSANPSVIANTTLRNSATPTWTDSVVSGVTKTLAQGKALDSDGATTLLANYIPTTDGFMFTCTPSPPCADATVTINGASLGATGDIPSGGSEDLDVLQGGVAAGSWNGSAWIIPTCPLVPSLSVALSVSNATPTFKGTITLTPTPTDIVPTTYTYWARNATESIFIGTSAGAINWNVVSPHGVMTITVEATDGTNTAYGSLPITVTGALGDRFTTASYVFSLEQRTYNAGFSPVILVRRSSDNTLAPFGFLNGSLDTAGILAFCGAGDGFVATWFDQSSKRMLAQQATAAQQPRIVVSGVLVTASNGKPALDFVNPTSLAMLYSVTMVTGFFSFQNDATTSDLVQTIVSSTNSPFTGHVFAGGSVVIGAGVSDGVIVLQSTVKDLNRHYMAVMTASNDGIYIDSTNITLGAIPTLSAIAFIGRRGAANFFMDGKIQDIISFPDDQFANRAAIESYLT